MAIVATGLTKVYGTQRALDGVSFEVRPGEVTGFLGPNGAGKSTTFKLITGFLQPTAGGVTVCGFTTATHSLELRRRIGYLPEHNPLYLDLYVQEFLRYMGQLQGLGGAALRSAVAMAIDTTGLGPEAHKPLRALSKGYRQRAGLAAALLHDPEVLLLDEPTSGLDPNQVHDIRALVRQLGQTKTVLFSSHILQEVEAVAQRVLILHQGRLVHDAPLAEGPAGALEATFRRLTGSGTTEGQEER